MSADRLGVIINMTIEPEILSEMVSSDDWEEFWTSYGRLIRLAGAARTRLRQKTNEEGTNGESTGNEG